jgi:hypothetical protein
MASLVEVGSHIDSMQTELFKTLLISLKKEWCLPRARRSGCSALPALFNNPLLLLLHVSAVSFD